jgi:diguanylate cyclase (GGDEF)-like protein
VLSVQSFAPYAYDAKDLRLLRTLSAPVATAIRNARLFGDLTSLGQKLREVEEASRRMKLATDAAALYATVLELTSSVLGYRPCAILEPQGDALVVVAAHEEIAGTYGLRLRLDGPGLTVAALRAQEPVYVPDVSADARYVPGTPDTRCELALPLVVGERVFGVLDVQAQAVDGIPPQDRDLLKIVASELAVALAGLERLADVKRLSDRLAGLHGLVVKLQRCTTVEEVCAAACSEAGRILGFTTCNVGLVEGDWLIPKASTDLEGRPLRRGEGIAWQCLETGQAVWGNSADLPRVTDSDLQSVVSVPISNLGVFQVASADRDAFSAEDVRLAEILAGHLSEEIRRIRIEDELREQAIRDPLTGLYNRRFLSEVLEREIARSKRYGHPLTLVMADLDDFKAVNDRYGHLVGDAVLRRVAEVLQKSVRAGDFVFRYGGDEFVLVLPETGSGGEEVLRRLQQEVAGISLPEAPGLAVSVGYAVWDPRDGPTEVETLLRQADEVVLAMKQRHRETE